VIDYYKHWLRQERNGKTYNELENFSEQHAAEISFARIGTVPGIECYNGCEKAMEFLCKRSLFKLLTEGKEEFRLK